MATDFTDGLALKALKNIFTYLPECYENGEHAPVAREKMANASTMQVWRLPMPFWVCATLWHISWVHSTTCLMAWQMLC